MRNLITPRQSNSNLIANAILTTSELKKYKQLQHHGIGVDTREQFKVKFATSISDKRLDLKINFANTPNIIVYDEKEVVNKTFNVLFNWLDEQIRLCKSDEPEIVVKRVRKEKKVEKYIHYVEL